MFRFIHDCLQQAAECTPHIVAVDDGSSTLTYSALYQFAGTVATNLGMQDLRAGDRIAVIGHNQDHFVTMYYASSLLGVILVPINNRLGSDELQSILEDCAPALVITDPEICPVVDRAYARMASPRPIQRFVFGPAQDNWQTFSKLCTGQPRLPLPSAPTRTEDIAVLLYTSGTTGRPKGATLSHRNILSLTIAWQLEMPLKNSSSRCLQVTPLFHVGALLIMMSVIASKATLVLPPSFNVIKVLELLSRGGITHTLLVPSMIQWLLQEPSLKSYQFDTLEMIAYGASPMPGSVMEKAMHTFNCAFVQGYGLTETAGVVLCLRPEDHLYEAEGSPPKHIMSAGRAVRCAEVKVVDVNGREVDRNVVGEVVARGDNITAGYWNDPESTAEVLIDGWFHTGDLATRDENGFIYIVDRLKDMAIVAGENVYPLEIEKALMAHHDIVDVAVIGIPHSMWGEQLLAFVVLDTDAAVPSTRELTQFCRERLARFKCPAKFEFVDTLPRTPAGKLNKPVLRKPYWKDKERSI